MKFSRKSWDHLTDAVEATSPLLAAVRRTVWSLEIGTVTLSVTHQPNPVTPKIPRSQHEAMPFRTVDREYGN